MLQKLLNMIIKQKKGKKEEPKVTKTIAVQRRPKKDMYGKGYTYKPSTYNPMYRKLNDIYYLIENKPYGPRHRIVYDSRKNYAVTAYARFVVLHFEFESKLGKVTLYLAQTEKGNYDCSYYGVNEEKVFEANGTHLTNATPKDYEIAYSCLQEVLDYLKSIPENNPLEQDN